MTLTFDLALLANIYPRINSIIGSNPGVWSSSVSGNVGAFPDLSEITSAALEADGELITKGYFNSANDTLAQPFMLTSDPLVTGDHIPFKFGNMGRVELAKKTKTFASSSVTIADDTITMVGGHGLKQGQAITFSTSVTLPGGLSLATTYYVIFISNTIFKVATSASNAAAGTAVDLTSGGTGIHAVNTWETGIEVSSLDDILNINASTAAYLMTSMPTGDSKGTGQTNPMDFFYKIENGDVHHTSTYARVQVPQYTRTAVLQAAKADETLIVALTIRNLTKHASPAAFTEWTSLAELGMRAILMDGSFQPPNGAPDENP